MNCGYGEKIIAYLYGEAGEGLEAEVEAHLAGCPSCRGELAALRAAGAALEAGAEEPPARAVVAVMRAAREASPRYLRTGWRQLVFSGALASAFALVFALGGRGDKADLAWNSGLDSRLDSVEYSVYQAQSDLVAPSGDWDYACSSLEDESLNAGEDA